MRRLLLLLGASGTIACVAVRRPAIAAGREPLPCLTPDTVDRQVIQSIKQLLVEDRLSAIHWREGFGMSAIDSSAVKLVADKGRRSSSLL